MKTLFSFTLLAVISMTFICCNSSSAENIDTNKNTSTNKNNSEIELVSIKNTLIGFTILVPKNAKTLADSDYGFITSYVFPNQTDEINISVGSSVIKDVDNTEDFKKLIGNMMAKNIIKVEKTENGMMAINEQEDAQIRIFHKVGKVMAIINAPSNQREIAETIAKSIISTK